MSPYFTEEICQSKDNRVDQEQDQGSKFIKTTIFYCKKLIFTFTGNGNTNGFSDAFFYLSNIDGNKKNYINTFQMENKKNLAVVS